MAAACPVSTKGKQRCITPLHAHNPSLPSMAPHTVLPSAVHGRRLRPKCVRHHPPGPSDHPPHPPTRKMDMRKYTKRTMRVAVARTSWPSKSNQLTCGSEQSANLAACWCVCSGRERERLQPRWKAGRGYPTAVIELQLLLQAMFHSCMPLHVLQTRAKAAPQLSPCADLDVQLVHDVTPRLVLLGAGLQASCREERCGKGKSEERKRLSAWHHVSASCSCAVGPVVVCRAAALHGVGLTRASLGRRPPACLCEAGTMEVGKMRCWPLPRCISDWALATCCPHQLIPAPLLSAS